MSGGLLHEALVRAADRSGDRVAIRSDGDAWSFRDLEDGSNAFAAALRGLGVGAHDRVAVMTTNRVEFVLAVNGISKLGAASVLLSPAWKATEVGHALDLAGARNHRAKG